MRDTGWSCRRAASRWFNPDSTITLTPEIVGPAETTSQGIVGLPEESRPDQNRDMREATLAFHLARDPLRRRLRSADEEPRLHLFGPVNRIVTEWLDGGYLMCERGTHPGPFISMPCVAVRQPAFSQHRLPTRRRFRPTMFLCCRSRR